MNEAVKVATALMKRGVLVSVKVGIWRAGISRHKAQKMFQVGSKMRLAPDVVAARGRKIAARIERNLLRHSYGMGGMRFITRFAYPIWKSEHDACASELMSHRDKLLSCWEDLRETAGHLNADLASVSWKAQHPSDAGGPPPSFTAEFARRVSAEFPSREAILGSIGLGTSFFPHEAAWMPHCDKILDGDVVGNLCSAYSAVSEKSAWNAIESTVCVQGRRVVSCCEQWLRSPPKIESAKGHLGINRNLSAIPAWSDWAAAMDVSEDASFKRCLLDLKMEAAKGSPGISWDRFADLVRALMDRGLWMSSAKMFVSECSKAL